MFDIFKDTMDSQTTHKIISDICALLVTLVFVFCCVILREIEKRIDDKRLKVVLYVLFVITAIWFTISYTEFYTGLPVKSSIYYFFSTGK